jgi:acyl-CoA hydrolase
MLTDLLAAGQTVFVPSLGNESALLSRELAARPERAAGVTFTGVQFPGIDRFDYLALHPRARQRGYFMSPALRGGLADGRAELLPLDYLGIARQLDEGPAPDVAIAQLTPPDAGGWCSPGLTCDFLPLVWKRAGRRVAHINPKLPRIASSWRVHVSELDAQAESEEDLLTVPDAAPGDIDARIGRHAAGLVRDGDTLQFGVGGVPSAIAGALRGHRRLHVHTGMVSSAVRTLWEAGALDRDATILGGAVLGSAGFYDYAARLERLRLTDVRHTHGLAQLAGIPRLVAINSALEVDLFGQVNAERGSGAIRAGAGGLPAFAVAAQASNGGRLLVCLPATAAGAKVSRIVPALGEQGLCTLPRHLTDAVATEYGVAQLRGLDLDARAQALIAIAHPAHRDALAARWDKMRRGF